MSSESMKHQRAGAPPDEGPTISLNLNVQGMRPSATVAINERSNEMLAAGREIYKLGFGQSPFPVPASVVHELRDNAHQKDYLPVAGLRGLREAVADYHGRRNDLAARPNDVLIGPGSKELMFLLQLVYDGELMVPTPAWVSYAPQAQIIGRRVHFMHARRDDQYKLGADQLEEACRLDPSRPRILVMNYPSNPHGGSYSEEELTEIARIARNYRLIVLSDEIYGELQYEGRHVSLARFYPEGTIVSSGLSKWCGAGGWRLGTFLFPPQMSRLRRTMAVVASETFTSTSAPIQYAAVRAYQLTEDLQDYLHHSRRVLAALGSWCSDRLNRSGLSTCPPDGGFYLFPSFEACRARLAKIGVRGSTEMCRQLLEDVGVALLPGSNFGRADEELTARLAYVNFDGARAIEASLAIPETEPLDERFLQAWCKDTLTAVERICTWAERADFESLALSRG